VVSSSGGALYGDDVALPTPEDAPVAPASPYGVGKWCAEAYAALYGRLHGLSTVSLRYGNVYGPRQDPLGEGGVVAIFCDRARRGEPPVVFGDGLQTRDFVHVDDVVAANLAAAAAEAAGPFNVGTGIETSVLDLAALVSERAPEPRPARAGEVRRSCLDTSRARAELGWAPRIALADGVRDTLAGTV
jgi:UDP-glucose 4-epimerase